MGVEDGTSNGGGTECLEGLNCLKSDGIGDRVRFGAGKISDVASWSSGQTEGLRTYKRRRHAKSSADCKSDDTGRAFAKEDCQTVQQPQKVPQGVVLEINSRAKIHHPMNCPDGCSERSWKIVLEHMYQSLSDDEGGMQRCIRDVLQCRPGTGTNAKDQQDVSREKCDSPAQNGFQEETSGRPKVLPNRRSNRKSLHTTTEMCRHAWFHILISDKFTSLCKLLSENFQGIKTERFFDLKLINSRMKDGAYEHSPMLFLKDIQQVWDKIQGIGAAMIALSKDLSDLSKSCYDKQFCTMESDSRTKPEQPEANNEFRVCTCGRCGEKADGRDYLVCDSCEEMYHVLCIEPPVEEIPLKSWYCSRCTTSGSRSPHENCVVCDKLMVPKTSVEVGNDSPSADNEMLNESIEDTKCATELSLRSNSFGVCKVCDRQIQDGEKSRICGHNLCASNSYHARCLTKRELRSYGTCWYCPSCLCRSCLVDKDDDQIVLCDGCDHGYHLYCTQPKLSTIPTGNWYCRSCDAKQKHVKRAREAYEKYEEKQKMKVSEGIRAFGVLSKNWNSKSCMEHDNGGGMEMLLTAVNTLSYEEKCGRF